MVPLVGLSRHQQILAPTALEIVKDCLDVSEEEMHESVSAEDEIKGGGDGIRHKIMLLNQEF